MRRACWLMILVGCTSLPSQQASGPQAVVSLKRGACRGGCPEYAVYLSADGRVVFVGFRNVKATGISTSNVNPQRVREVIARFEQSGYAQLPDQYTMGSAACGRYASDAPVVETSLLNQSSFKTVLRDGGCSGSPAILRELEQLIDEVAQTARWVGP
ncbi:MAG: DUF6438 domain-containing protein [Gemmatimonadota bacterium]